MGQKSKDANGAVYPERVYFYAEGATDFEVGEATWDLEPVGLAMLKKPTTLGVYKLERVVTYNLKVEEESNG